MRSHRFYTPIELQINQSLVLPKEASHHCVQVLRYHVDAELTLFNGDGFDYIARIEAIDNKQCRVKILSKNNPQNESPLSIHLFQGVAKGDKMDLIIQKSVELGVTDITPIFTVRSNVKLDAKRLSKKHLHWQKIAISASEQCGRAIIAQVHNPLSLKQLTQLSSELTLILDPQAKTKIQTLPTCKSVSLVIGPEGGLSVEEVERLNQLGAKAVNIGPRILRTETAGLTSIAILQSQFGDL